MPKIEAIWERRARIRRWAQVGSITALILYFVFLSSLLSYFLIVKKEENSIRNKIEVYEERIKSLKTVEAKQFFLKAKLKEISPLLMVEEDPAKILKEVEGLALKGIKFLKINYEKGNLRISGEAKDAVVMDKFVKNLEDKGKELFSQAELEVNKVTEGDYLFNLLLLR